MLLQRERSCLLLIDLQERLVPAMEDPKALAANARWLVEVARAMHVPVTVSEQYPRGLGHTVAELRELLTDAEIVTKEHFSCVAAECFGASAVAAASQIVIGGAEAHVCVLQTAVDLVHDGKEVFVVADAVASRRPADKALALDRMRAGGVSIVSREMVAFEWLGRAGTGEFREISRRFLRADRAV